MHKCLNKIFFNILLIIVYSLPFYFIKKKIIMDSKIRIDTCVQCTYMNLFAFVFGFFRSINIFCISLFLDSLPTA